VPDSYGGTIDFVLVPEARIRDLTNYLNAAETIAGTRGKCSINFWVDRSHIPTSAWIPVTDLQAMTAYYERHPNYATPVFKLACWLYPTKEVGESEHCFYMPGAKMPWDKAEAAANVTPQAGKQSLAVPIALAVLGLILIFVGFIALWYCVRVAASIDRPKNWRSCLAGAVILGVALALASWPGTYWLGYPLGSTYAGPGRAVGIPFMAAWFDSEGRDYVGPMTLPAVCANAVFWLLVPSMILGAHGWRHRRRLANGTASGTPH
jgi:hypothetical protein